MKDNWFKLREHEVQLYIELNAWTIFCFLSFTSHKEVSFFVEKVCEFGNDLIGDSWLFLINLTALYSL